MGQNQNRNHIFFLDPDFFLLFYATNREVDSYNLQHLKSLNRSIMNVKAVNTSPTAKQASQKEADNLKNKLLLSMGAKIMLL